MCSLANPINISNHSRVAYEWTGVHYSLMRLRQNAVVKLYRLFYWISICVLLTGYLMVFISYPMPFCLNMTQCSITICENILSLFNTQFMLLLITVTRRPLIRNQTVQKVWLSTITTTCYLGRKYYDI